MSKNGTAHSRNGQLSSDDSRRLDDSSPSRTVEESQSQEIFVLGLSPTDQRHLEAYEKKLQLVRDRTTGVAIGYATGLILTGPGGTSKSYTVFEELRQLQVNFRVSNSRMTGRGLFDTLTEYPDCVHVLEDVESMLHDTMAIGVLRSALWGQRREGDQGPQERWVTWMAHGKREEILFTGGLILICNRGLSDLPEIRALQTRVPCIHLQPGDDEMRAMMRRICLRPFEHEGRIIDPPECMEVCEFVIAQSSSLHRPLDLRLLVNSLRDYLQWQEGDAGVHWTDMVAANVRKRPVFFQAEVVLKPRAARKQMELEIAREIMEATNDRDERRRIWEQRTGKSEKALYRRMQDVRASESENVRK